MRSLPQGVQIWNFEDKNKAKQKTKQNKKQKQDKKQEKSFGCVFE